MGAICTELKSFTRLAFDEKSCKLDFLGMMILERNIVSHYHKMRRIMCLFASSYITYN